jgi:hypothetical protein
MDIIEEKDSLIFILPFKMKYFYVYNDIYFKNKGVDAKISVLIKKNSVIKGGGNIEEKMDTLSIPYKYIYYIMEKIRSMLPSLPGIGSQKQSDGTVFTTFVNESKKENNGIFNIFNSSSSEPKKEVPVETAIKKEEPAETTPKKEEPAETTPKKEELQPENPKTSFFNMFNSSSPEPKKEEPVETTPKKEEPQPEKTKSSFFNMFNSSSPEPKKEEINNITGVDDVKLEINPEEKEEEKEKVMDTSDTEKLKRNSENLLFKIQIFGNIKKVNIENNSYVEKEKIINEIWNNNNGEHRIHNEEEGETEESEQDTQKKNGGIFNLNNTIIIIGELTREEINKLKQGIEYTEAYNKLLL